MQNLAAIMPALRMITIGDVRYPQATPCNVIVRSEAIGACGSDVTYSRAGRSATSISLAARGSN